MGCHLSKVTVQAVDQASKVTVQAEDQKIMIGRVVGDPLNMSLSDINDDEVSALELVSYRNFLIENYGLYVLLFFLHAHHDILNAMLHFLNYYNHDLLVLTQSVLMHQQAYHQFENVQY